MHDCSGTRLLENHPKSQSSLLKVPLFELEEHPWRVQGVGPNPKTTNLRSVCVGPTPNTTFSSFQKGKTGHSKWQSNFHQEDRLSCDQSLLFMYFKNSIVLDFLPTQRRVEWWVLLLQDHWLNSSRRLLTRRRDQTTEVFLDISVHCSTAPEDLGSYHNTQGPCPLLLQIPSQICLPGC